nr:hypothetical protein B0A51_05218 [Rachicladosporium sp. CCFEE 5018]
MQAASQSESAGYHAHPQSGGYSQQNGQSYGSGLHSNTYESPSSQAMQPYPYQQPQYGYQQQPPTQSQHPQPQYMQHPSQQPLMQSQYQHGPPLGYPPPPGARPMYSMPPTMLPPLIQHPSTVPPSHLPPGPGPPSSLIPSQPNAYHHASNPVAALTRPDRPLVVSNVSGKYRYALEVVQEPQRARMCGFGDKDRRPITPPPCVRLRITLADTGEEVPHKDLDGSFFILQVDLWDKDAGQEVNIVKASSTSPAASISTAQTTSFPPVEGNAHLIMQHQQQHGPLQYMGNDPNGQPIYGAPDPQQMPMPQTHSASTAMYTRNLIGSLTVNASSLNDTKKQPGFWFVLQDLSVRMEGHFRLKMNFIDVGSTLSNPPEPPSLASLGAAPPPNGLHKGRCPVLASVFSEPFQVFSAKKFPGVIESTSLSKVFAAQGIKIPIRKEGRAVEVGKEEDEEGDD